MILLIKYCELICFQFESNSMLENIDIKDVENMFNKAFKEDGSNAKLEFKFNSSAYHSDN
jgi:hypothetical protein